MNSEPCVRFGMRISPKISENPADSRNSSPPKAMLLPASISDMLIGRRRRGSKQRFRLRSAFQRRVVARVDRLLQKPFFIVGPELADLGISFDRPLDQLAILLLDDPDVIV